MRHFLCFWFAISLLLALTLGGCDLGEQDRLYSRLNANWTDLTNTYDVVFLSLSPSDGYYNAALYSGAQLYGRLRVRQLSGGRFRLDYTPTSGRALRSDIGRFDGRALVLVADSAGASERYYYERKI